MKLHKSVKVLMISILATLIFTVQSVSVQAAGNTSNAELITVDLVVFAGQSNMEGPGGSKDLAPVVPRDCGYEFRNGKDPKGLYEVVEPFGFKEMGYLGGRDYGGTLVSSFMNTYYGRTSVPVLGVYAAKGGTSVDSFWIVPEVRAELFNKYNDAVVWCSANNVKVRHKYLVWYQGESDCELDANVYRKDLGILFSPLFANGLEQVFVITPGYWKDNVRRMDGIVSTQERICAEDPRFTLGTKVLRDLSLDYIVDDVHYNQSALNIVGTEAGNTVASYTLSH